MPVLTPCLRWVLPVVHRYTIPTFTTTLTHMHMHMHMLTLIPMYILHFSCPNSKTQLSHTPTTFQPMPPRLLPFWAFYMGVGWREAPPIQDMVLDLVGWLGQGLEEWDSLML